MCSVVLQVDARVSPCHIAAVLFIDDEIHYTDGAPSEAVLSSFKARMDNQITSTEMLSISLGLSTFEKELRGRKVIVYSDNRGAEQATRKGTAREWDHCLLIHEIWAQARGASILMKYILLDCFCV